MKKQYNYEFISSLSSDKICELSQISELKELEIYTRWLENELKRNQNELKNKCRLD